MDDEVLYGLGVDINSQCTFVNGDLALSSYEDNLIQAIVNRLNTDLDELDFYYEYGSILTSFYGWRVNDETFGFMKAEINKVLSEEPRLVNHDCEISYTGDGTIKLEFVFYPSDDVAIEANMVLTDTGAIELEMDTNNEDEEEL